MSGRDEAYWAKPVRTLDVKEIPAGATSAKVDGRRVAGAAQGFGQLWHKRFRVRIVGANVAPQEVIRVWEESFVDFRPKRERRMLQHAGITPCECGGIVAGLPRVPSCTS